jgi:hypothetical protein
MARIASTTPPADAVMPVRHPKAPAIGSQIPSHFGYCFGCGELHKTGLHLIAFAGKEELLVLPMAVCSHLPLMKRWVN